MDAVKTANMAQEVGEGPRGARTEAQQREMEARMMRSGLNVVWKMGKLLLEERCRRVCEIMFSKDPSRIEPVANALIQVGAPGLSRGWLGARWLAPCLSSLAITRSRPPSPCECVLSSSFS